ncbi:MAG: M42 family metallopeptidase [Candidatus Eremiobacteraeota bacterium]|nr:M42 family metallopeptidase [Candidatus Eremiobacteraeota bacterium]
MLNKKSIEYLQSLVECHGGPGYEQDVQQLFRQRIKACCQRLDTDRLGSVVAVRNPKGSPRILLDAHADEIAFVVKHIDEQGFLHLAASGGWDAEVVVGQRVLVHGIEGPRPGVIGKKAIHLMDEAERSKKSQLDKLWVDLGARDGEQARQWVEIGDSVTMHAPFTRLLNNFATAKSFDNRAGLFVVSETLRGIKKTKAAVHGVSAVQEEIGLRGAVACAYLVEPDIAVAIDVTHANDQPDGDPRKVGDIKLGKGPVIVRGPNVCPTIFERLVKVAKKGKIPHQIAASGRGTGTDANVIQLSRGGVSTGLIGLPLRYMHNPCELLSLEDLESAVRLLVAFVESY